MGMVMSLEMYANIYVSHAHWLFKSDLFPLGKEKKWQILDLYVIVKWQVEWSTQVVKNLEDIKQNNNDNLGQDILHSQINPREGNSKRVYMHCNLEHSKYNRNKMIKDACSYSKKHNCDSNNRKERKETDFQYTHKNSFFLQSFGHVVEKKAFFFF